MKLIGMVIMVVCILWFISIFETTPQFDEIRDNQDNINSIVTDLNTAHNNTLVIADYEIPMVGEILGFMGNMINLISSMVYMICLYLVAFLGLASYIPAEASPIFTILTLVVLMALISYIRLGWD